ncbi:MAG: GTP-binding protein [archaeon]|nr:GTP-binding protein [archaeon]
MGQMPNAYMQYDPNNPYAGYYGMNMYGGMMPQQMYGGGYYNPMMGQQPMMGQPNMQPGNYSQPQQFQNPPQQAVQKEEEEEVVGLGKKKGKKKKGTQPAGQPSPQPQQAAPQQFMPNQGFNQPYNMGYNQGFVPGGNQGYSQGNQQYKGNKPQKKPQGQSNPQPQPKKVEKPQPKPAPKKVEQPKETKVDKEVKEATKAVEQMSLENRELEEDSFEGKMIEVDKTRQPVSIVFVGHVDSGKSTISGSLLYNLGQVDERTIEKYQREAKVHNRESWFMAYIMDVNEEEKEKGKTVEIGKAFFETKTKRFTLLDAPGHSGYIPNLLQGACQADFAGLVIAAKKGEFEAGFDKSGSTREHALLLKALGVSQLIVMVNKMDEETVKWDQERYEAIKKNLKPFLKSCGYQEKNIHYIPISGLLGENLTKKVDPHKCPWYDGPCLVELLDTIDPPQRDENGPVRVSILDRYKENSLFIMGKLESGIVKYGETYTLMPNKIKVEVGWLFDTEERSVPYAKPGESIRIRCKGIDSESDVSRGNILCSNDDLCAVFNVFEAEIIVLELQEQQIIANGFKCILHFHTYIEECTIDLKCEIDKETKTEKKVKFVRSQARIKAFVKTNIPLCGEKYEKFPNLGRFSMRYEGQTIAIGKILKYKPYNK